MSRIGKDCDITLQHTSVNNANPYGFILKGPVEITREAYNIAVGAYQDRLDIECVILLAETLANPNGTRHTATRSAMYAMLLSFLAQRSAITLTHAGGTITLLCATLVTAREEVYTDRTEFTLLLNNGIAPQTPPEDTALGPLAYLSADIASTHLDNLGTWASAPATLETIGNMMATREGTVGAWDIGTGAWKLIAWTGTLWIGDTTYIIYPGTIIAFTVTSTQSFYLPWIPTLRNFAGTLNTNQILVTGIRGKGGTIITADTPPKTVTFIEGVVTAIV
jgi:hypothetical protein